MTNPGDRNNADVVLQVSISANEDLYEKIRRDSGMCEALRRLMKDEIAEILAEETTKAKIAGMEKGMEEGMERGMEKGMENAMLSAIANLMDTMKWTAEQAMEAIKVPLADRGRYSSQL
ncbi:MAG: hypothetical protein HFH87_08355 [Lachnospiraceae bacterium]|nr:hypothetical protein [Lachnospiraceae bacterium]